MIKTPYFLSIVILGVALQACNESVPLDIAENSIIYEAPENAAEAIEAAWQPTSLLQANDHAFYYADEATRRIVEFDIETQQKRVLFDLSGDESYLFGARAYDASWGTALIRADENWIVLAAPQSSLIWMNTTTGEKVFIGECNHAGAVLPKDGEKVGDMTFDLFG